MARTGFEACRASLGERVTPPAQIGTVLRENAPLDRFLLRPTASPSFLTVDRLTAVPVALAVTDGLIGLLLIWRRCIELGPFEWRLRRIGYARPGT
mgnify:FL=1